MIKSVSVVNDHHVFIFSWKPGNVRLLLNEIGRKANDPLDPFTHNDAAVASQKISLKRKQKNA